MSSAMSAARLRRLMLLAAAGGGGALVLARLRKLLRAQRATQAKLAAAADGARGKVAAAAAPPAPRVGVDRRFVQRLLSILRICVPGMWSRESGLIALQGVLLLSRTLLSKHIAGLEGRCGEKVTAQDWVAFRSVLKQFALLSMPASVVNAALKAVQVLIHIAFRQRLTAYLHKVYMENRAYYSASVLGGLAHADQRLTDDVEKFCETIAELYSRTLKPTLDVIFFTHSLARIIGYKGQAFLYTYFIFVGAVLRALSPPLGLMAAQYSNLNGDFRSAHARVTASAEEIAFNDPPAGRAEMQALNARLNSVVTHARYTAFQRFLQSSLDGYATKYTATIIGLVVFAVPLYMNPDAEKMSSSIIAGKYINVMRLMMQSSTSMGALVVVHKHINTLAGYTARVSELLEQVKELGKPNGRLLAFQRSQERVRAATFAETSVAPPSSATPTVNGSGSAFGVRRASGSFTAITDITSARVAKTVSGPNIELEEVSVWAPDGTLLVRDLSLQVPQGSSVIIEGPNGSGKSSLLRTLSGLWPLQSGTVTLPPRDSVFFLSQKAYIFAGGSLAEQLMYPNLPGVVVGEDVVFDVEFGAKCLEAVELPHLVIRCNGFSGVLPWTDILSGGERNRLAVARLLYHRPRFAFLDECTAAVSSDGELVLYKAMADAGISMVSVAHRKAVRPFHQHAIVLTGDHGWEWKELEGASVVSDGSGESLEAQAGEE